MRHSFGIVQPYFAQQTSIPGTSRITTSVEEPFGVPERKAISLSSSTLSQCDLVLVPQPSNDPNDPLNWTAGEKRLILLSIGFASAIVHALGPMMSTSYLQIAGEFHQTLDRVTQVISGNFALTSGVGTLLVSAFGICYGKRPAFLLSATVVTALTLWLALEKHFAWLAVARALQGLATAPLEVLVTSAIADLYFVHERGTAMALIGSLMLISILSSQIMGGFAVQYLGFRSLFWITASLTGLLIPLLFFLVPETSWRRIKNISDPGGDTVHRASKTSNASAESSDLELTEVFGKSRSPEDYAIKMSSIGSKSTQIGKTDLGCGQDCSKGCGAADKEDGVGTRKRKSWSARLQIWSGRIDDQSYWMACIRPLLLLYHPAVVFGILVHGLGNTYLHAFAFAKLRLFSAPPYNLTPSQIGLTVLPGAATGLVGQMLAGYVSDHLVRKLAQRNKGIYEAEFRLLNMIPQTLFSFIGFCGFGVSVSQGRPLWLVLSFFSCVTFSVPFGSLASLTYLVDSVHRQQEALVATILFKSFFVLIFSSVINGSITKYGVQRVFITLGILNLAISSCTLPFYIFGKVFRGAIAQSKRLQKLDSL